jgi:hypothetical protein
MQSSTKTGVDPHWVSMRIRIQLFISVRIQNRIRIQGAKPMRIHADLDSGQTFK